MSEHMALENLTVLDLTRVLAGPFCTMMLADMGANVIKIEVPKGGDDTRSYPPFRAKNLNGERESVYFANINRNKKGITLNLKAPEGKEIFKELVKKADIVVENYRPGVMDKLGLGYDVLKEINPRIIYRQLPQCGSAAQDHQQSRTGRIPDGLHRLCRRRIHRCGQKFRYAGFHDRRSGLHHPHQHGHLHCPHRRPVQRSAEPAV